MRISFIGVLAAILLSGCATGQKVTDLRQGQTGWVSYPSTMENIMLSGELILPEKAPGRVPAMIIAHSSGGMDARDDRWARFLADNGIAAFKMDYFGPRGVTRDSRSQPTAYYDAYDAARLLATHPRIDPDRIGVIGWSRGGNIAAETANATPDQTGGHALAAHVALYPLCGLVGIRGGGSGAPVFVLVGTKDQLAKAATCEGMVERARGQGRDAQLKIYEGAYHNFDGDFSGTWYHAAMNSSYDMYPHKEATEQARKDVLAFLRRAFKL